VLLLSGLIVFVILVFLLVINELRKRQAQKLEREKRKIFENIVHEIRSPVTLIQGPVEALKKATDDPRVKTHLVLLERNVDKLMLLVNELIDASKIDQNQYSAVLDTGEISLFIEGVLAQFHALAQAKKMRLSHQSTIAKGTYHAFHSAILEKIVSNLVGNAVKYCLENSEVWLYSAVEENRLILVVEDNGPGIPSADHKKVFTRFYRGKNGQSQSGSGIGLSIVKDLTALIEGSVYLESESGKGAKFTVNLPVEPISYPLVEIEKQEPQALSVLICDDDKDIQSFLRLNLQDDFKVYTADNGIEGLQICYDQNPDIVLADVMMPLKGGIEMLKELKANKLYAHIPVVLISAKSSGENRLEGLKAGADAYIKKPFNTEELLFTLKNITSTIHKALNEFKSGVKSAKAFDERIKSTNEYVNKAIEAVVRNIENPNYSVNELAKDLFISRSQLHRKLSNYTGFTTSGFIQMIRLEKAKDLLLTNQGNVTEIAFLCGFSSPSYFSSSFTKYFGVSPSKYAVGHVNGVNMK
jgi:DNA-binding response OmpR family regulator/nitrogen-specific signal transduction histidine kinase